MPIYDRFWIQTQRAFRERLGAPLPRRHGASIDWGDDAEAARRGTLWELLDMDIIEVGWPMYDLRLAPAEVLEETAAWALIRDGNEACLRWWKHKMGTPEHVSFGIDTPDKWARVKPNLRAAPARVRWDEFRPLYERARAQQRFICYGSVEIIEAVKDVLGHETMLRAMIKQPQWIHDVFDAYARLQVDMFRLVEDAGFTCDGAFIYGDIAYKNGPFMSPRHYREFVQPYHQRLFDEFHRRNMPILFHSDGDVRPLIPALLDAGIAALNPLEAKAGMDLRELAPQYGHALAFCGNIDVTILATNDRDRIRAELAAKLGAAMPYRGYVYHSDHSIPPDVAFETYHWLLGEVRRLGRYD